MENGNKNALLLIDGFGETMLRNIEYWAELHWDEFLELKKEFIFDEETENINTSGRNLDGLTFVITGSLNHFENRDQLKEKLESLGAKVSGSVSAKTFALICNDDAGSSKSKKAASLGIQVWTEEQLLEYIK
jgi:DNA ligase (NAD+)